MELRERLENLAEPEYQRFSSSLIPNIGAERVLGVRLPNLRKIAKEIAKGDWREYLKVARDDSFEEVMLQGMVIGYAKTELSEMLIYIEEFLPKIDNWSVCDSFCTGLKVTKQYPDEIWRFIIPYLKDTRPYYIRFGVVMLIDYYIDKEHIDAALQYLDSIHHEDYYVKMAVAWAVSMYYVKLPEETLKYLKENHLDDFTYNKALQKITESLKVDNETKQMIKNMKR